MQRKQLEYKTLHHLTTSSMLCYSSKYKQTEIKANHYQTGLSPHSALPIRGKTNKQTKDSAQISPYMKLNQTTGLILKWSHSVVSNSLWPHGLSLLCSSIHGIFQAKVLEWVAISFSRGSSWPSDWTQVSHVAGRCFNLWATREAYAEDIMWNAMMEEARAGIQIARRNISNLRYADDTTLTQKVKN